MLKLLFSYYKPYRKTLCALFFLSLFTAVLDLVFPMLVRHILDVELPGKNTESIFRMVGILFALYCVSFALMYFVHYRGTLIAVRMENDMRQDLFRHFEKMSFRYFDDNKTGQLLSRITTDLTEIGELTFKGPNDLIICSITMLGTIAILIWMNPSLASVIVLLLIIKTVHTVYINRKMKNQFRANRALYGEVSAQAAEALSGIRLIKAFALEEQEADRFADKCETYIAGRRRSTHLAAYFSGSITFFSNLINVVMLSVGGWLIATDRLKLSDFVAFYMLICL